MTRRAKWRRGFTLLELLVAMGIFMVICGAMFELLDMSQRKFNTETQLTSAYQDARLAMDQIVTDIDASGYPPSTLFSPIPTTHPSRYALSPVAWSPNYLPGMDCQLGATCVTPGDYDLIIETRLSTDTYVSWVWYHLDTTKNTLFRTVIPKTSGDPLVTLQGSDKSVAFLANVMNNPGAGQLAQITADYPSMFPGNQPQPIFQYSCDSPTGAVPCASAGSYNSPRNIRDVDVTLIVKTAQPDLQTQRMRLIELNGRGHRVNPVN
jgi:prepilin-type N-terminal cleavage/methylation domain-containing protein